VSSTHTEDSLVDRLAPAPPASSPGPRPVTRNKQVRVVSARKTVRERLTEIWAARELLVNMVRTEIRVKYKNSFLGMLWSMLSPAMTLAIYVLVFQVILKNGFPDYVIFLFSGLLPWNLFQTGVQTATGVIVSNSSLVKRVAFPREILALAAVGSAFVFFFFQACVMVIFMVVLVSPPAWHLLWLLLFSMVPLLVFASGLAVLLASVNVYFRDMQHLVEVLVGAAWFWACPIVYSFQESLATKLQEHGIAWIYLLNPLTPVVMTFQRVLYNRVGRVALTTPGHPITHLLPSWHFTTYLWLDASVLGFGILFFWIAMVVFGRLAGNFAEEL
jgi:ABC-2 type transport system permease protein